MGRGAKHVSLPLSATDAGWTPDELAQSLKSNPSTVVKSALRVMLALWRHEVLGTCPGSLADLRQAAGLCSIGGLQRHLTQLLRRGLVRDIYQGLVYRAAVRDGERPGWRVPEEYDAVFLRLTPLGWDLIARMATNPAYRDLRRCVQIRVVQSARSRVVLEQLQSPASRARQQRQRKKTYSKLVALETQATRASRILLGLEKFRAYRAAYLHELQATAVEDISAYCRGPGENAIKSYLRFMQDSAHESRATRSAAAAHGG